MDEDNENFNREIDNMLLGIRAEEYNNWNF